MMDSVQRIIGIVVGVVVSLILLVFMTDVRMEDAVIPLVIGGLAAWAWPVVIAFWLGRRARQRNQDRIEDEVQRQLGQQQRK